MEKILAREKVISLIRTFFKKSGFIEVETPLLTPSPDTAPYNEVFETEILGQKGFLAPSPEFFMKKIIAGEKLEKIFQICKAFRNSSELDPLHNPEFTILEWYRTGADYTDLMRDCEKLINYISKKSFHYQYKKLKIKNKKYIVKIKNFLNYRNQTINIAPPWLKISVKEAFKKYADINLDEFLNFEKEKVIAKKKGYKVEKETTWEQIYHQIFLNEIEPNLPKNKPVILYDYPAPLAALAKLKDNDQRYAERFEFYIGGIELGNGYSELTDWREQERRLINDMRIRREKKMKVFDYDHDFVEALKTLPKTAGIAVGIDRLVMLFTDSKTIQEVISFPATKIFSP